MKTYYFKTKLNTHGKGMYFHSHSQKNRVRKIFVRPPSRFCNADGWGAQRGDF